jgi:hypothetical protein
MRRFLAALILLGQAATITCYRGNVKRLPVISLSRGYRHSSRLFVVEHLVDCAAHPEIAEVYGALANDFCLQSADSSATIFRGLGGFVEQAATIGFLVIVIQTYLKEKNHVVARSATDEESLNSMETQTQLQRVIFAVDLVP